ncbi:unnamed protein product [Lepeophtheirus salmonis]|uniref:(salmon louse) hypothetical protein n=1 Tax=Lepeophtheirus salmonis TaxID=72036 RepID=A0A7R8GZU0_LEPSM|nr:unnamed protein product [Lepeophtheirus salmonis]CAF2770837.1 unnamed protein product [Lepeophtheirus salmonis]
MSLNEKIREFKSLQEDRVREHKKLDLAFKTYLSSGPEYDFKTFQVAVGEATKSFKDTSNEILKLKSLPHFRKRLKETVEYQLLAQEANDDPDDDVADARDKKPRFLNARTLICIHGNVEHFKNIIISPFALMQLKCVNCKSLMPSNQGECHQCPLYATYS